MTDMLLVHATREMLVLAFHGPALIIENSRIVSNTLGMRPGGAAGIRSHTTPLTLINSAVVDNRG